jgi:hypothetical protein
MSRFYKIGRSVLNSPGPSEGLGKGPRDPFDMQEPLASEVSAAKRL